MKLQPGRTRTLSRLSSALVVIALVFGMISGCVLGESKDDDLHQTETALAEQQTKIAQTQASSGLQSTVDALQGTVNAQNVQATANAALPPTLSPEQVQQTSQALEATKQPTQIPQQPPTLPPSAPTNPPPPPPQAGFEDYMRNASVLLYESTAGGGDTARIAKFSLQQMGITNVTDVGDAIGRLKSGMMTYGPTGKGWDLIFIDAEGKDTFQGEFFTLLQDQINHGSSVVLTIWYLNWIFGGMVSSVLDQCGVYVSGDWSEIPTSAQVMYPYLPDHPIVTTPNPGLVFNRPTGQWLDFDVGDLLSLTGKGDAALVFGTDPNNKNMSGLVTACMKNHLVLQSFASHIYDWDTMNKLFQNYITFLLRERFNNP